MDCPTDSGIRPARRQGSPSLLGTPEEASGGRPVLLLVVSGVWPLPLINVVPALRIAFLAIALLQEDRLLLAVSFVGGILALLVFGFSSGHPPTPSKTS
jgi:hypothetical protein